MNSSDQDQRKIKNSITLVRYVTFFAVGWVITAYLLEADRLLVAALIATVGFVVGILLHKAERHLVARLVWLCAGNAAVLLASFVTPTVGQMSTIFVAFAAMPFVVFRQRKQRLLIITMVLLPMALWLTAWAFNSGDLSGLDVTQDVAENVLAPASAFTTFGVVLFVIGYFVRTSEDHLRTVISASKELKQTNDAKMRLLESLSHEMRTPLQAIYGYAELIQMDSSADISARRENAKLYSQRVLRASLDLLRVLDNIFDFVRRPDKAQPLAREEIALKEEIDRVLRGYAAEIAIKGLEVYVDVASGIFILTDRNILAQVVKHIIDNAIKFSPDGGAIAVTCEVHDEAMRLVVQDEGPGFPKGASQTAFTPFDRLGYETSATPGAGIGLALARDAVERLGGSVSIEEDCPIGGRVVIVVPTKNHNSQAAPSGVISPGARVSQSL